MATSNTSVTKGRIQVGNNIIFPKPTHTVLLKKNGEPILSGTYSSYDILRSRVEFNNVTGKDYILNTTAPKSFSILHSDLSIRMILDGEDLTDDIREYAAQYYDEQDEMLEERRKRAKEEDNKRIQETLRIQEEQAERQRQLAKATNEARILIHSLHYFGEIFDLFNKQEQYRISMAKRAAEIEAEKKWKEEQAIQDAILAERRIEINQLLSKARQRGVEELVLQNYIEYSFAYPNLSEIKLWKLAYSNI